MVKLFEEDTNARKIFLFCLKEISFDLMINQSLSIYGLQKIVMNITYQFMHRFAETYAGKCSKMLDC